MDHEISFSDSFPEYQFLDAQYLLNPQEIVEIDKDVRRVIYRKAVAQKIFPTKQIPRGISQYKVSIAVQPSAPIFSMDFIPESMDKIDKEETTFYLIGISKDYFLSMVDIDASRNSDYHRDKIDTLHLREMTALVADFKERVLWRGEDIKDANPGIINTNVTGLITASGITTFEAGAGGDDATGAAGDGPASIGRAMQKLIQAKYEPPYDVVMTSYLYAQFCINQNSTTHELDIERMNGMTDKDGGKVINKIHVTDHLLNADDDGSASAMAVIAPKNIAGEDVALILESYPLWHYPITTNRLGIQGKVLWFGGAAPIRPDGIALAKDIDVDG
ncbi:MAG: hypothetical protein ACTSUK_03865 [Promethearchaeota archaeon]